MTADDDSDDIGLAPFYSGPQSKTCRIQGCNAPASRNGRKGMCEMHHSRARRHNGNPLGYIANTDRRHVRLDEEKVVQIRALRAAGIPRKPIAEQFGCDVTTISAAVHGKNWAWVGKR